MSHAATPLVMAGLAFASLACGAAYLLTLDALDGDWRSDNDQGLRLGWRPGLARYEDPARPHRSIEGDASLYGGVLTIRSRDGAFRDLDHVEQFAITVAPRLESDCRMWMELGGMRMRRLTPEVDPELCVSGDEAP